MAVRKYIVNIDDVKSDIKALLGVGSFSADDAKWFARVFTREVLRTGCHRPSGSDPTLIKGTIVEPVLYQPTEELMSQSRYILDWLSELSTRDHNLHSKLPRITFQQAYQHSEKWHAALAKAAEKSERYVEPDEENAPKVLDLGDGWEVFWLKTDLASDVLRFENGPMAGSVLRRKD